MVTRTKTDRHVNRNSVPSAPALLSRQEALAILEKSDEKGVPIPFDIAFCTCDESKHTGGEIIRYQRAIWHVAGGRVRKSETFERIGNKPARKKTEKATWCRLIRAVDNDQIRQLHADLILTINGQAVR